LTETRELEDLVIETVYAVRHHQEANIITITITIVESCLSRIIIHMYILYCYHYKTTYIQGLLTGEIDQRGKVFRVSRCTSRDVQPQALDGIIDKFKSWRQKCNDVTRQVESSNQTLQSNRISDMLEQNQLNIEIQRVKLTQKVCMYL